MKSDHFFTRLAVGFAGLRPRLRRADRSILPPGRACILLPTGFFEILAAGPLLQGMIQAYPQARYDWVVTDRFRPLIAAAPHLHRVISAQPVSGQMVTLGQIRGLATRLQSSRYDTALIPSPSPFLSYLAWRAEIPQRIGLDRDGRSVALTGSAPYPADQSLVTALGELAAAAGVPAAARQKHPAFHLSGPEIDKVTNLLVDEIGWSGNRLIVIQPGGTRNLVDLDPADRWPLERFVLLGNALLRSGDTTLVVIGSEADRPLTNGLHGMMIEKVHNLTGRLSLGEIGALCQVADLFVSNLSDQVYLAAAVNCPAIGILGADPLPESQTRFGSESPIAMLYRDYSGQFDWSKGVLLDEVLDRVDQMLER